MNTDVVEIELEEEKHSESLDRDREIQLDDNDTDEMGTTVQSTSLASFISNITESEHHRRNFLICIAFFIAIVLCGVLLYATTLFIQSGEFDEQNYIVAKEGGVAGDSELVCFFFYHKLVLSLIFFL